jgi:ABC-type glycerol-3-phosphate transport system substrate-binding protein
MFKKVLVLTLVFVAALGLFLGGDINAKATKKLAPATIKFWVPLEGTVNDQYWQNATKEFEKAYPQIKVELTKFPTSSTDGELKLNAALLNNDYPDVLAAYLLYIGTRGAKGDFADLRPYLKQWSDKADLMDNALKIGVYKGKQFGIGFYPAPQILTYRTDYFKEAGLDPGKPPANWEEIRQYADKLVKKDSSGTVIRAGYDIPAIIAETFLLAFMRQGGSLVVDERKEKTAFANQKSAAALAFMTSLKKQSIPYDGSKLEDFPFLRGNAAMGVLNINQINKLLAKDSSMRDKLAFAPVIKGTTQAAFCGYRLFTIGARSKYKSQSWEFIKFMMSKEQMMKRAKEINIPIVRKSIKDEYINLNPTLNKAIVEYTELGKGMPVTSWTSVFTKYIRKAYEETYAGQKAPLQALKDADAAINKELKGIFGK